MGRTSRIRNRLVRIVHSRPLRIDSHSEFVELCKWMSANGWNAVSKNCLVTKPALFNSTGRGLMAMSNIAPNHLLVQIPQSLLITKEKVLAEIPDLLQFSMTTAECLTFFILNSKFNGLYSSYISTLPKSFSVGGLCKSQEIAVLPSFLQEKIMCNQNFVLKKYEKIFAIWRKIYGSTLSLELFQWAWFCVNTRAVFYQDSKQHSHGLNKVDGMENNMALAPYLDMFNHDAEVVVEAGFNKTTKCYEIRSDRHIKKYQQVFINYGPHDNMKLFLEYGFLATKNLHKAVEFDIDVLFDLVLGCPSKPCCLQTKQIALLRQLSKMGNLFCSQEGFSWNAQIALTMISFNDTQLSKKFCSPLEIIPDEKQINVLGRKLVNYLIVKLRESLNQAHQIPPDYSSSSFNVAKLLMEDMINILVDCILVTE